MPTLNEFRRHILDDAGELAQTTGIATPLMNNDLDGEGQRVARFLRASLSRHTALVVLRLYDPPGDGRTGPTASITAALNAAASEGILRTCEIDEFKERMCGLKDDLEARGVRFIDLRSFRNAELAHSLHRNTSPPIPHWPIWEFAHDTFELVLDLDNEFVRRGAPNIVNLDQAFDEWRDLGEAFWATVGVSRAG